GGAPGGRGAPWLAVPELSGGGRRSQDAPAPRASRRAEASAQARCGGGNGLLGGMSPITLRAPRTPGPANSLRRLLRVSHPLEDLDPEQIEAAPHLSRRQGREREPAGAHVALRLEDGERLVKAHEALGQVIEVIGQEVGEVALGGLVHDLTEARQHPTEA